MTWSTYHIIEVLVEAVDEEGMPATPASLAERVDGDPDAVRDRLDVLRSHELIADADDGGVVPTVTGRELLELGVDDDDFVVIETPDDDETP